MEDGATHSAEMSRTFFFIEEECSQATESRFMLQESCINITLDRQAPTHNYQEILSHLQKLVGTHFDFTPVLTPHVLWHDKC
jgi:nucleosome binding factor SPN SPT16 subunit